MAAPQFMVRPQVNGVNVALTTEVAGLSLTEVEVNLSSYGVRSGSFQITGLSGLTTGRHVLITQALGPYTGKGNLADEAEMDQVSVSGKTTSATTIQCYWASSAPVLGNFKFAFAVG